MTENEKKKISIGLVLSKDNLKSNPIFTDEIQKDLKDTPYYLLIFITQEGCVKISCFPTETNHIKKVLISLKEFTPDLVKGISTIFKELDLSKDILHTTGVCYKIENCFYETYLKGEIFMAGDSFIDDVKKKFLSLTKVVTVEIEDIKSL